MKIFTTVLVASLLLSIASFGQHATIVTTKGKIYKVNFFKSKKGVFKVRYANSLDKRYHIIHTEDINRIIYSDGKVVHYNYSSRLDSVKRWLVLTSLRKTNRRHIFKAPQTIKYKTLNFKSGQWSKGTINAIGDSSLTISSREIPLDQLVMIKGLAYNRRGAKRFLGWFSAFILGIGLVAMLGIAISSICILGNCPSPSREYKLTAISTASIMTIWLLLLEVSFNKKYHLNKKWTPKIETKTNSESAIYLYENAA